MSDFAQPQGQESVWTDLAIIQDFIDDEVDGRRGAGSEATDYLTEALQAQEAVGRVRGSLGKLGFIDNGRIAAEAYQVIGALADATGTFGTPEVQAALIYFHKGGGDESILPFRAPKASPTPITMQDVRLRAGEGKLSAADVLAACNAELAARAKREGTG